MVRSRRRRPSRLGGEVMGAVRTRVALGLMMLLSARQSVAGTGYPALNSRFPARITLVGSNAGVADGFGKFTVTVIDLAGNPMHNVSVVVYFTGCPDIAICSDQLDPDAKVDCALKGTRKFTDSAGQVSFIILGGGSGSGDFIAGPHSAQIFANGSLIGRPTAAVLDLDGHAGVAINDLSVWLNDFAADTPPGRSEF